MWIRSHADLETAFQFFEKKVVVDGDLCSKDSRNHFDREGYLHRGRGCQSFNLWGYVSFFCTWPVWKEIFWRTIKPGYRNPEWGSPATEDQLAPEAKAKPISIEEVLGQESEVIPFSMLLNRVREINNHGTTYQKKVLLQPFYGREVLASVTVDEVSSTYASVLVMGERENHGDLTPVFHFEVEDIKADPELDVRLLGLNRGDKVQIQGEFKRADNLFFAFDNCCFYDSEEMEQQSVNETMEYVHELGERTKYLKGYMPLEVR